MEKRVHPITERQLKAILVNCDQDQDHALSFREFLLLCQHVQFNDFSRPFHNSQFLGANKCEQDQMVGKKSKSKSFRSGPEEKVSEKVSARKCDNKQLNRITKGTVKEHIQFFNGKIKSAREEAELKRKQMENLPKHPFAGGSTNCVEKNSKLENYDNAGFQPPKPPPLPKSVSSSQDPPLGSSDKTVEHKAGDETPAPEGSHSREKNEDSGTEAIITTGQKSEQAGAAESVRALTVPPSDSSTELVCFESMSDIQATSTSKSKPVDSGCCNDDKNETKITSSSESYLDCQDVERGIDAVQLLDKK
jgi:hypothetical protein